MLKTVARSESSKTKKCAITYRSGARRNKFGTCPSECKLNPTPSKGTDTIDEEYLDSLVSSVPKNGISFTYSHFSPLMWKDKVYPGSTVINYSADNLDTALKGLNFGMPTVTVVDDEFWNGKRNKVVEGVKVVRCLAEYHKDINCSNCGDGKPLCARGDREYPIGFTAHGSKKIIAKDTDTQGGCYGVGSHWVKLHWDKTSEQIQNVSDSEKLSEFVKDLPRNTILRHHVVGDLGRNNA